MQFGLLSFLSWSVSVLLSLSRRPSLLSVSLLLSCLIPVRTFLLPKWFTREELAALDGPTASPFTMESVGGTHGFKMIPMRRWLVELMGLRMEVTGSWRIATRLLLTRLLRMIWSVEKRTSFLLEFRVEEVRLAG